MTKMDDAQMNVPVEDEIIDAHADEQALFDLMVTLAMWDESGAGPDPATEKVIADQIVLREEAHRNELLEHVARLRQGERPIGVRVFISYSNSDRLFGKSDISSLHLCEHGTRVASCCKTIFGRSREEGLREAFEMRLADIFGEQERATRLSWAGDSVQILKSPDRLDSYRARYYACTQPPDDSATEGRNLYVLLKAPDGSTARAKLSADNPGSVLEGDSLPADWEAVFVGLAVD